MEFTKEERVTAKGKNVLVIGGGDTGSDCIGTAHRQGAKSVTQIEIMPKPPVASRQPTKSMPISKANNIIYKVVSGRKSYHTPSAHFFFTNTLKRDKQHKRHVFNLLILHFASEII